MNRLLVLVCFILNFGHLGFCRDVEAEKTAQYWKNVANLELVNAVNRENLNKNIAKNVIVFLGDGMSGTTITAARILKGQLAGESGEENKLTMDRFHHAALSRTYSVNRQVADSASTATAYLGGVKTNNYMLGLTGAVTRGNCQSSHGAEKIVSSVLEDAYDQGKSAGIVTTTRIQHATPGGAYAHTPDRTWYSDAELPEEAIRNGCKDIARQFIDSSYKFKVVFGGGRSYFLPNNTHDVEYPDVKNRRLDGQDLIQQWKDMRISSGKSIKYVWNKTEFDKVDPDSTDYLLGLFEPKDMQYEADRHPRGSAVEPNEPSIAEMTEKAIRMLQKNPEGYVLLVEGGRIDHAHHAGNAFRALHDTVAFDDAIKAAVDVTSEKETLIIVTADHGHTLTLGGYSHRGNDIFGFAPSDDEIRLGEDNKPFTSLLYANGPGYKVNKEDDADCEHEREDLTNVNIRDVGYLQQAAVPLSSETHGGEDVNILARGPMAHLFHGVHEQNYIAAVIRYASCIGDNKDHCKTGKIDSEGSNFFGSSLTADEAITGLYVTFFLLVISILAILLLAALFLKQKKILDKAKDRNYAEGKRLNQTL